MRPRLLGEIVARAPVGATMQAGRAPNPDPDAVARLVARRLAAAGQVAPVTGADDVARLVARRAAVTEPDTAAPVGLADVDRLARRRTTPARRPAPPEHDAVTRLAARRTHLTVPTPDEQEQ